MTTPNTECQPKNFTFEAVDPNAPVVPFDHLIEGLLLEGNVSCLYGDSNAGKTAIGVCFGALICKGMPLGNRETEKGAVLHMALEGPHSIRQRAVAQMRGHDYASPYLISATSLDLANPHEVAGLICSVYEAEEAHGFKIRLIIIDTLTLALGIADENSSRDMKLAVEGAKQIAHQTKAHVMLIHHSGKGEVATARGSSALRANVDTELMVSRDSGSGLIRLVQTKQRDMEKGEDLWFEITGKEIGETADGGAITTAFAELAAAPANLGQQPGKKSQVNVDRVVAVELAIREALQKSGSLSVRPADVAKLCAADAFTACATNGAKLKAVQRLLADRAKDRRSQITAIGNGQYGIDPIIAPPTYIAVPKAASNRMY